MGDATLKHEGKAKYYNKESIERSGNVSADKITIVTDKTKTEMQWDLFDKVIEADDLVLVAKDKEYMAFVPYMFSTMQDWMTCREIVKSYKTKPQPPATPNGADRAVGAL